jgi:hypothetical protein
MKPLHIFYAGLEGLAWSLASAVIDVLAKAGPVNGTHDLAVAMRVELASISRTSLRKRSQLLGHRVDTCGPAPTADRDIGVRCGLESVRPVAG